MTSPNDQRDVPLDSFPEPTSSLSTSLISRVWRLLIWGILSGCIVFSLSILALSYLVLPNIEKYRPNIEQWASEKMGQTVHIGKIEANWSKIRPSLTLRDVRIGDTEEPSALTISHLKAVLSWKSLPSARLKLQRLEIEGPNLHLRRSEEGRLFIAGAALDQGGNGTGSLSWILEQENIRIHGATLVWQDEMRKAPVLTLKDVDIASDNHGEKHQFGLTVQPPDEFASRIDLRGDVSATNPDSPSGWAGQIFAEVDSADLAIWRHWVDYPLALPRGQGALRAWLTFASGAVQEVTADVVLKGLEMQAAADLPPLELASFSGRLQARFPGTGSVVKGRGIELLAQPLRPDGSATEPEPICIESANFDLQWQHEDKEQETAGSIELNHMDVSALIRMADHLPLDVQSRQWLADYAPQGQLNDLNARWKEHKGLLQNYSLKTNIANFGIKAKGVIPGFSGLSGSLEIDEKGGKANLDAGISSIDLPTIFSESLTKFDSLTAQASWTIEGDTLEVVLAHAEFSNLEAAGSANGLYRTQGDGPGFIDMTAALTRGDARAVWRYLPKVVNVDARHWLRDSLLAGHATQAQLILKGNLQDFPFSDKQLGQFLVTVKARDAVLDYGKGWPRIENIQGDLRFEGNGMEIDAQQGSIFGAKVSKTRVTIPDFHMPVSNLHVKGQVDGPTAEFLKFIDQSPVAEQIDRFTDGMRATGNGRLMINLSIPLLEEKLDESKITGTFQLINNVVTLDAALPPLRQTNGEIRFSRDSLTIPGIDANLLGGPLKIQGGTQKDNSVLITANGTMDVDQLRKQVDIPLLSHLSGTALYRGEVSIHDRNTDLKIESDLVGLSSALPTPFAKVKDASLPFFFEKKLLPSPAVNRGKGKVVPSAREQIVASLGSILSTQWQRRKSTTGFVVERGAISIGAPLKLPRNGFSVDIVGKELDLDTWQEVLTDGPEAGVASISPDIVRLKTEKMNLRGLLLKDVNLVAAPGSPGSDLWRIRLNSQQVAGNIFWQEKEKGRLVMRLEKLIINDFSQPSEAKGSTRELPAMDIIADAFSLRQRNFGRLELQAENNGNIWSLKHIQTSSAHGSLVGSGRWKYAEGQSRTELDFKIDSANVGRSLERMGYPRSVRSGTARLEGKLSWNGPPTEIDFGSMSGDFSLEAHKGEFLQLDPGVGKLLGLISLQSLPRRITLDFRDIFRSGFAFDTITGKVAVQQGVMQTTEPFIVIGPAAQAIMRGEVNLQQETQHLVVNVLPEVGETAALGVAIINPVAGAATWLANRILQNPLGSMFGFNYLVTGTWDDPVVEKLATPAPEESGSSQ